MEDQKKEIVYIKGNGITTNAIVADIDYDIGVSVVDKNDNTNYLLCFHGPMSPIVKKSNRPFNYEEYDKLFDLITKQISEGRILATPIVSILEEKYSDRSQYRPRSLSVKNCAFSQ